VPLLHAPRGTPEPCPRAAGPPGIWQPLGRHCQAPAWQVRRRAPPLDPRAPCMLARARPQPGRACRTDNAVKNRWHSSLKREAQAESGGDCACPATKRSWHPAYKRQQQLRLACTQLELRTLLLAGKVRG